MAVDVRSPESVRPSIVDSTKVEPFTLEPEYEVFGTWVGRPLFAPAKDSSEELAKALLSRFGMFASRKTCWNWLVVNYKSKMQQVREIDLPKASIRLPKGRIFVNLTPQSRFDEIQDVIPTSVQMRLDEFLEGEGSEPGVKVWYLEPLATEEGSDLRFTTKEEVHQKIEAAKNEVFAAYRRLYARYRPLAWLFYFWSCLLNIPAFFINPIVRSNKRQVDNLEGKLEFERRKLAMEVAKMHGKVRTSGCSYDEVLRLTNPLNREDVVRQLEEVRGAEDAQRVNLMLEEYETAPLHRRMVLGFALLPYLVVEDPAFVAEIPGQSGLLRIGHFDTVDGVTHVEL